MPAANIPFIVRNLLQAKICGVGFSLSNEGTSAMAATHTDPDATISIAEASPLARKNRVRRSTILRDSVVAA
jgi:hypothetical protein